MKSKLIIALISAILYMFFISNLAFAAYENNHTYICEGNYSTEMESGAVSNENNTVFCPYGCNTNNPLNWHVSAGSLSNNGNIFTSGSQADICNPQPIFVDAEIIGLLFGFILFVLLMFMVIQRI